MVQFSHLCMTTGKTIAVITQIFVGKVMSLLFNTLSRFLMAFVPRSKHLLISWLQSSCAVILEPCFPIYFPWRDGTGCYDLSFWMLNFKLAFSLCCLIKRLFSSSLLSAIKLVSFSRQSWFQFVPSRPAFHMLYSACKLKKQGDNIQPWCTLFPGLKVNHDMYVFKFFESVSERLPTLPQLQSMCRKNNILESSLQNYCDKITDLKYLILPKRQYWFKEKRHKVI